MYVLIKIKKKGLRWGLRRGRNGVGNWNTEEGKENPRCSVFEGFR